jgi:hypothetical protein
MPDLRTDSHQKTWPLQLRSSLHNTGWAISRLTLLRDLNAYLSSDLWPTLYTYCVSLDTDKYSDGLFWAVPSPAPQSATYRRPPVTSAEENFPLVIKLFEGVSDYLTTLHQVHKFIHLRRHDDCER